MIQKSLKIFYLEKNAFLTNLPIPSISFVTKSLDVDQVLTKILQIDQKLVSMFFIF